LSFFLSFLFSFFLSSFFFLSFFLSILFFYFFLFLSFFYCQTNTDNGSDTSLYSPRC
jgi:hypothetical protein